MTLSIVALGLVASAPAQAQTTCPQLIDPVNPTHTISPVGAPDVAHVENKLICPYIGYPFQEGDGESDLADRYRADFVARVKAAIVCAPSEPTCDAATESYVDWVGTDLSSTSGSTVTATIAYYSPPGGVRPSAGCGGDCLRGYQCRYSGVYSGLTGSGKHTFTPSGTPSCGFYYPEASVDWMPAPQTPMPPDSEIHKWDVCLFDCDAPVRFAGDAERIVALNYAKPHWTTKIAPWDQYSSFVGSSKTSGSPGDWDVYVNVYRLYMADHGVGCEYHARVTGTEHDPVVTRYWGDDWSELPPCATY